MSFYKSDSKPEEYAVNSSNNFWPQPTILGPSSLATQLLVRPERNDLQEKHRKTKNSQLHTGKCHIESAYPNKRRPRADHPHGRPVPIFSHHGHSIEFVTLSLFVSLCLAIIIAPSCVSSQRVPSPRVAQAESKQIIKTSPSSREKHSMSTNLKQFSNLNEDLVFEDSLDVQTNHYNETDQDVSATVLLPASGSMPSFNVNTPNSAERYYRHNGRSDSSIHRLDSHSPMSRSALPPLSSNHLTADSLSDLAPRSGPSSPLTVNRDILPKRRDPGRLEVLSDLTDNSLNNLEGPQQGFNDTSLDTHSIVGDHILRPFFRKDRKLREQQKQQQQQQQGQVAKSARPNKIQPRGQSEWSVPVIELKRLNDRSRQEDNFKRLPLMGNEEGFILTGPNSSLQSREALHDKHKRSHNFPHKPKPELRRRFGDLPNESTPNHIPSGSSESHIPHHGQPIAGHDPFRMNYHIDDIALNDLDLDDVRPARLPPAPPRGGGNGNNFMARKPIVPKLDQTGPSVPNSPPPSGEPLPQIMPLFFDKFLSEFEHSNAPISPEGFALPPNQDKFAPFEHSVSHPNPNIPPPQNPLDSELGDLDAPNHVERRLTKGNLAHHKPGKPEIGPPLFSNEIVPTNEFENDFGSWPKIFRFTDGRINLHDFEREKKRARIKFSQKMSKSQALFNIKRESFLILHGGTFSQ